MWLDHREGKELYRESLWAFIFSVGSGRSFERSRDGLWGRRVNAEFQPDKQGSLGTSHSSHHRWQARRVPGRSQYALTPAWSAYSLPETQTEQVPSGFSDKYWLRRMLGKGSFGTVRSAVDKSTGLEWAVKIMPKKLEGKDPKKILQRIREEVCHHSDILDYASILHWPPTVLANFWTLGKQMD